MDSVRGIPFQLHPEGDAFSDTIRRNNDFYEADILDYIRDNYPKQKTIIDAGANIGNHTVYFATFLTYDLIVSFEPYGKNFSLLSKNIERYGNVKPLLTGLSNKSQWLDFEPNFGNMGAGEIREGGSERIYVERLDSFSPWFDSVTLLKMDVERHEPQAIEGAKKTIERDHPLILIEDADLVYNEILEPLGYTMVQRWPHHKTYLWKWNA